MAEGSSIKGVEEKGCCGEIDKVKVKRKGERNTERHVKENAIRQSIGRVVGSSMRERGKRQRTETDK